MKLYFHPISTTCRPVMFFAAEAGIKLDYELVDLMTGAQYQPPFTAINASSQVPVLDDGDFRLTESSAILKYLAEKAGSPAYPSDLRKRALVNSRMDWFNTSFYRDCAYCFIYPQIFDFLRYPDEKVNAGVVAAGREKALRWFGVLDQHLIGPRNRFLCGDDITIADYFGSILTVSSEAICCDLAQYPNITRWMNSMKALKSWAQVNETFYKYLVEPNKGKQFVGLGESKKELQPA